MENSKEKNNPDSEMANNEEKNNLDSDISFVYKRPTSDLDRQMHFDVSVAEFNSLRMEQIELVKIQNQLYNYLMLVTGALLTVLITVISKDDKIPPYFYPIAFWTVLLFPLISAQISFLFFDQELVLHAIGSYLHNTLYPRISKIISAPDFWDFSEFWNFNHLNISTRAVHHFLYQARWTLFLVPTVLPTVAILIDFIYGFSFGFWWKPYMPVNCFLYFVIIASAFLVWLADFYICLCLWQIIYWTRHKKDDLKIDLIESGEFTKYFEGDKFKTQFLYKSLYLKVFSLDQRLRKIAEKNVGRNNSNPKTKR